MIEVIAFDVFGTVFDTSTVDHSEVRDYVRHIREDAWSPLILPDSWKALDAHPDSACGIEMLRKKFMVVTCSNGPVNLLAALSKRNCISWDAIIPLEMAKVYKPKPKAYMTICDVMKVEPSKVMMVTANETFGDIEASWALGMTPMLIRGASVIKNIIDLASALGCSE